MKVAELINPHTRSWINSKLTELFDDDSISAIKKIVIPATPTPDKLVWILDSKGNFTVKSAFNINNVQGNEENEDIWKKLWKLSIHDRLKMLIWRIVL